MSFDATRFSGSLTADWNQVYHKAITAGTASIPAISVTSLDIKDANSAYNLTLANSSSPAQSAAKTLTFNPKNTSITLGPSSSSGNSVITFKNGTHELVDLDSSQTLAAKNLVDASTTIVDDSGIAGSATFSVNSITAGQTRAFSLPDATSILVNDTSIQTLSNKKLVADSTTLLDQTAPTKIGKFSCSGITAGQTRTMTLPDASTTLVGDDFKQSLSAKGLIFGGGSSCSILDSADNTKVAKFNASTITTGTTRTYILPDADGTISLGSSSLTDLKNCTIEADTCPLYDSSDNGKQLVFDLSGISAPNILTVASIQNTSKTATIPNLSANDEFAMLNQTQSMLMKTISFPTTGGTPSPLDYYEELLNQSIVVNAPFTSPQTYSYNLIRIGKLVILNSNGLYGATNANTTITIGVGLIPVRFRPQWVMNIAVQGDSGGTLGPVLLNVYDNGNLEVSDGFDISPFPISASPSGIFGAFVAWVTA